MKKKPDQKASSAKRGLAASPGVARGKAGRPPVIWLICLFLAAITWTVFGQTLHFGFINYDDPVYVSDNAAIVHGFNWPDIKWVFTHTVMFNWHPLTMLSHMLDCQLYGLNAGGHHFTSVLIHTLTVISLFLLLRTMTGALWRSAFVAAVFAIHPLKVESVAWVAERKDVLSGLFFILTIGAYLRYVRQPSWRQYLVVLLSFILGLMSKSMLVTLPFVLLLLDYWPLHRSEPTHRLIPWPLIREKMPLLALTVVFCVITLFTQEGARQIRPLPQRLGNALVSYLTYLEQTFYPAKLAVYYPYPEHGPPRGEVIVAVLVLIFISVAALMVWRRHPYFLIGWLWYLGMLVPVIGLVQVGYQPHADRYTYLPQIGICIALTWLVADLSANWPRHRLILGVAAAVSLMALIIVARKQTSYWHNSGSLWTHTIVCTSNNVIAYDDLSGYLLGKGDFKGAMTNSEKALEIKPDDAAAHDNLGIALLRMGDVDAAIVHLKTALKIEPTLDDARVNLANALLNASRMNETNEPGRAVLNGNAGHVRKPKNFIHAAWVLATSPDPSLRNGKEALELAQQADRLSEGQSPLIIGVLAAAYAETGRYAEAIATSHRAIQVANAQHNRAILAGLEAQLKCYEAGKPFRDPGTAP